MASSLSSSADSFVGSGRALLLIAFCCSQLILPTRCFLTIAPDVADAAATIDSHQEWSSYRNLVLEGGGAKGISYIGVFKSFKENGLFKNGKYTFENITGNSVGCLFGLLVSLDIDPDDLETLVVNTQLDKELFDYTLNDVMGFPKPDGSWYSPFYIYHLADYAFKFYQAWNHDESPGLSDGEKYVNWLNSRVLPLSPHRKELSNGNDGQLTFERLKRVTGHNLNCLSSRLEVASIARLNAEITPDMRVFDATYVSGCLPLVRKPVVDQFGCTVVDGGIYNNFPIYEYDYNDSRSTYTLGVSLNKPLKEHTVSEHCTEQNYKSSSSSSENKVENYAFKHSSLKYADVSSKDLAMLMIQASFGNKDVMEYSTNPRNDGRVIYVNSELSVTQFDADENAKKAAIKAAKEKTDQFFQ